MGEKPQKTAAVSFSPGNSGGFMNFRVCRTEVCDRSGGSCRM